MPEPIPALVLMRIRNLARYAERTGSMIHPDDLFAILEGKNV